MLMEVQRVSRAPEPLLHFEIFTSSMPLIKTSSCHLLGLDLIEQGKVVKEICSLCYTKFGKRSDTHESVVRSQGSTIYQRALWFINPSQSTASLSTRMQHHLESKRNIPPAESTLLRKQADLLACSFFPSTNHYR
jgi:hypothetical protein